MAFQYSGNAYDIGGGHARHACFLLHGLKEVSASLSASGVPFFLLRDDDDDVTRSLVPLLRDAGACLLVADVDPLREAERETQARGRRPPHTRPPRGCAAASPPPAALLSTARRKRCVRKQTRLL